MSVHSLRELMDLFGRVETLTAEERQAASVLAAGVERVFPKGRVYTVLTEDTDPALRELEALDRFAQEANDTLALIEDRLTEIKRLRRQEWTP